MARQSPSKTHANNHPHNCLIYKINDAFLDKYSHLYRGRLYDLGCGEMPYKDWFLNFVDAYVGVDWSGTLHDLTADVVADMNEPLPIDSDVADTIVSLSVMEHLREPQIFLSEAYRILKRGGAMILQVPFMWWVHEAPYDYYRYTPYGLKYLFEKAGFVDVDVEAQTGFWVMWTLKFNYQTNRLVRGPWLVRAVVRTVMRAIWAVNQPVAFWLDRRWPCEQETAGYFVVARKTRKR